MPFTFGRNYKFGLNIESTYNTYVAPAAGDGIALTDGSIVPAINFMETMSAQSLSEKKIQDVVAGPRNFTARVRFKMPKEGLGQLLKNAFGSVADTAVGATFSGTRHVISPSTTTPTSISLLYSDDIQAYQLSGAAVKSVKFIGEVGEPIVCEVEFIGGTWVQAAAGVGSMTVPTTASTINPYWHTNAITTINVLGAAFTPARWEYTLENTYADGLAESYEIQTTTALNNARKQLERAGDVPMKFTLQVERLLQNTTSFLNFQNNVTGTSFVELKETATSTDTSTGTNDYYVKIQAVASVLKDHTIDKASDLFKETLLLEGYRDTTSTDNAITYKDKQTIS